MSRASRRILAGIAGCVVVAAIVTAIIAATRTPATLPPGSPEGAVQAYLEAVLDRDSEAVVARLDPALDCDITDVDLAYVDNDVHVALRDVDAGPTTALVDVQVTTGTGELIPSGWTEEHTFRLVVRDGDWLISGSPWPLFGCTEGVPR